MGTLQHTSVGTFEASPAPEGECLWKTEKTVDCEVFSGTVPVYVMGMNDGIPDVTVGLMERILSSLEERLIRSVTFIRETLQQKPEEYGIAAAEMSWLQPDTDLPVDLPELTFYAGSSEWIIRFAEGRFRICDPYGIGVSWLGEKLESVDNLRDSEEIE